ncbi:unnamed protein product [Closterium sp. Naga37s-1]|nr:unnamed protein product [Closterium sp. Naga37s-1]
MPDAYHGLSRFSLTLRASPSVARSFAVTTLLQQQRGEDDEEDANGDPSIERAVREVEAATRVRIVLRMANASDSDPFQAEAAALQLLLTAPHPDVLLGPPTSLQASIVGPIASAVQVPLLSYAASDPLLNANAQLPYFVRMHYDDQAQMTAVSDIISYYNWTQVVALFESTDSAWNGFQTLTRLLQQRGTARVVASWQFDSGVSAVEDVMKALLQVRSVEASVFVLHLQNEPTIRLLLKTASQLGLFTEGYVWIATAGVMSLLAAEPRLSSTQASCEGMIGTLPFDVPTPHRDDTVKAISGVAKLSPSLLLSEAEGYRQALYAYDAVKLFAAAHLDTLLHPPAPPPPPSPSPPSQGNSSSSPAPPAPPAAAAGGVIEGFQQLQIRQGGDALLASILSSNMSGVTGEVSFTSSGDLQEQFFRIANIQYGIRTIGFYHYRANTSNTTATTTPANTTSSTNTTAAAPAAPNAASPAPAPAPSPAAAAAAPSPGAGAAGNASTSTASPSSSSSSSSSSSNATASPATAAQGLVSIEQMAQLLVSRKLATQAAALAAVKASSTQAGPDGVGTSVGSAGVLRDVVWPGGTKTEVPVGSFPKSSAPLQIAVPVKRGYHQFVFVGDALSNLSRSNEKFSGFCIDVFKAAVALLPYNLQYQFVAFGDGQSDPNYDTMVAAVANKTYDAAVGDITITAQRAQLVEFTQPFEASGLTMIVPVQQAPPDTWAFFRPFTPGMWVLLYFSFFYTALVVWFLEHLQNDDFGGKLHQQLATSVWFSFSTMTFSQEENVKTTLGRIVVIVWLFVVFVISSAYTASLSSVLTVSQSEPTIQDFQSLVVTNDAVGYQRGSFSFEYLRGVGINESRLVALSDEAEVDGALNRTDVVAMVDEEPYVDIFLSDYCAYSKPTHAFATFNLGFAFQKGSSLANDMSIAIEALAQNGQLQSLHDLWLHGRGTCSSGPSLQSIRLGPDSFWGLFLLYVVAACGACLIYVVLLVYRGLKAFQHARHGHAEDSDEHTTPIAPMPKPKRLKSHVRHYKSAYTAGVEWSMQRNMGYSTRTPAGVLSSNDLSKYDVSSIDFSTQHSSGADTSHRQAHPVTSDSRYSATQNPHTPRSLPTPPANPRDLPRSHDIRLKSHAAIIMGVDSPRRTFLSSPATVKPGGNPAYKASGNLIAAAALSASASAASATAAVAPPPASSATGASPLSAGLSPHRKASPSALALMMIRREAAAAGDVTKNASSYLSPRKNSSGAAANGTNGAAAPDGLSYATADAATAGFVSLSLGDSADTAARAAMNLLSLEDAQNAKVPPPPTTQQPAAVQNGSAGSPLLKRVGSAVAAAAAAAAATNSPSKIGTTASPPTAAPAKFVYHEDRVRVVRPEDDADGKALRAKLVALVPFQKGQLIAKIDGVSWDVPCSYSTVQYGAQRHLELNSDLVYMNHSCDPNVAVSVGAMEVRALQAIPVGAELTFFYPSSEWEMQQPFTCWCGSDKCVRLVAGAKFLTVDKLSQYFVNAHIRDIVCNTLSSKLPKQHGAM